MTKEFEWVEKVKKGSEDFDKEVKENAEKYDRKVTGKDKKD
ncbi:hypothetical protein LCGC14_1609080 [marine sediment metagenome]|uniref:Uncharacterized protein n=1 Tax=marine sediment metagenome TaxID=412755 RepID=A0A0F9KPS2_9ZZZZ